MLTANLTLFKTWTSTSRMRSGLCAAALVIGLFPGSASAQMVPWPQCNPRPCKCDDMPILERFQKATNAGKNAWERVRGDFAGATPPASMQDARARFNSYNPVDPVLIQEGQAGCPQFNGGILGGIDKSGTPVFDPCYCKAFCDDIVSSTAVHELRHKSNMVLIAIDGLFMQLVWATETAGTPSAVGDYNAWDLTNSEVDAYTAQAQDLQQKKAAFMAKNTSCTWPPVVQAPGRKSRSVPPSLFARLRLLFERLVHG